MGSKWYGRLTAAALCMATASAYPQDAMTNKDRLPTDCITSPEAHQCCISFIKHGSLSLNYEGKVVYIDPVRNFKPYSDFTIDYSTLDKADVILITHEHDDHCDAAAVKALMKNGTQLICNAGAAAKLGIEGAVVMKNGDVQKAGSWMSITAVPAHNTTPGRENFHPANGRDNGYVLTFSSMKIYIAGDTEVVPDQVLKMGRMDAAFLPVNQPYTMTPEQANTQARKLKPKILYPYHYGDTDISKLSDLLRGTDIEVRIRGME